ncbi:PIR protein, putative [Plasmodium sp.]|nr:PIR protein, putative [Plasmodium sp.]
MKLHYAKILLFSIPLNILITALNEHNKNKTYITPHASNTTSRVLIECNIYIPNYDNDPDINSVRENFHEQTEQRFHEYDKRIIKSRKKYKEQCDKDIQQIILKDKMQKSLAEKVEKGCLMCGYGLGGVAAGVGVLGTAVVNVLTKAATAAAVNLAIEKGIEDGVKAVILKMTEMPNVLKLSNVAWSQFINGSNYNTVSGLVAASKAAKASNGQNCIIINNIMKSECHVLSHTRDVWFGPVVKEGTKVTASTIESVKGIELGKATVQSTYLYSTIAYSVIAILIILLVMIIIYLVLRYRRKNKMNKKLQYTKLLS